MASDLSHLSPDAERALHFPVGVASPLWWTFGAAAASGAAWWWMTRWTRASLQSLEPTNLEAVLPAPLEAVEETTLEALEVGDTAAETGAAAVVEAVEATDDLTRLVGVGPRLAQALAERGVRSFAEIAAWTEEDLAAVDRDLDLKGRAVRDAWVDQAKRFAEAVAEEGALVAAETAPSPLTPVKAGVHTEVRLGSPPARG